MPDPGDTLRVQFGEWTLRVRRAAAESARLMLLIHGWTGDENSMWVFARSLPLGYWVIAPRAPHAAQPSGYSWRVASLDRQGGPGVDDLRPSAEALIALVQDYSAAEGLPVQRIDVMGFSQGAVLAAALVLLFPDRIRRAAMLSGFVPNGADKLLQPSVLDGKPFFLAHGSKDQTVDVEHARRSVRLLQAAGARVTFCEDEVGHKVGSNCMRGLLAFFA